MRCGAAPRAPATKPRTVEPEVVEPEVAEPQQATHEETQLAPRWKVILHDDPVTTFEFVIELLEAVFQKPTTEAVRLTTEIHQTGSALVAVANQERAELYVEQVRSLARPRGFPLTATMEPA